MSASFQPLIWLPLVVAMTSGCSTSTPTQPAEIDGATVYANQCGRCHEFRSPTEYNGPQWSIISTHMRIVGGIPADEARAVYEFLKSQHHPAYTPPDTLPGQAPDQAAAATTVTAADGARLLKERGCLGCHAVAGQGGAMGPTLDGVAERRSADYVRGQLRDPKSQNPASLMPNLGLSEPEIEALWAYLQTLDGPDDT